ncbi:MAG: cyclic nucleotide-binding domain-containing protein, partial [Bacteroidetes bacterium]|nr:cyclic nucleotide-binding domain-containing protein [Bacteroidota bacterium]
MTKDQLIDLLATHRTIGGAPREELAWIATHGTLVHYEAGQIVVGETESVNKLLILLSGCVSIYMNRGGGRRKMMDWKGGDVTGLLPYSRLKNPPGDTHVEEAVDALEIDRKDLPEMIRNCHEVTSILVHVMTDRARRFTSVALRDEKMISLGTLAAGLAHELNNPASAAMRNAELLVSAFAVAMDAARAIGATGLSAAQISVLDDVWHICTESPNQRPLTGLALADREDTIAAWLEDHELNPASAEDLAKTHLDIDTLNRLAQALQGSALEAGLRWIAGGYAARSLVDDIRRATSRIHSLVAATKGFTNMDRSSDQDAVDIAHGLLDTVALLDEKARERSVTISVNVPPDLPPVWGFGAEINQIWMNLIDNAI